MLKIHVNKKASDWDVMLPSLLFAYCEVPQESMGFALFDLLKKEKGQRSPGSD